jgi:WD40 repeat protein
MARRLRERDFSVFFSEEELVAGSSLTPSLRRALERSTVLIVVLNREVLKDPRWIRDEVRWFRAKRADGFVCPVSIDGALADPALQAQVADLLGAEPSIWVDESAQAWQGGTVSPQALARLVATPLRARANRRWRALRRSVMAALALATIAALWQTHEARVELRRSIAARLVSEAGSILAGARDGTDERAMQMLLAAWRLDDSSPAMSGVVAAVDARRALVRLRQAAATPSFIHDGSASQRVVLQDEAGAIMIFDALSLEQRSALASLAGLETQAYAGSADGSRHAVARSDGSVTLWHEQAGTPAARNPGSAGNAMVFGMAFNDSGSRLVVLDSQQGARLVNSAAGTTVAALQGCHTTSPMRVAHDARSARFLTAGPDAKICVWDAVTGAHLATWPQKVWVTSLSFSPDGQVLAVGRGGIFDEEAGLDLLNAESGMALGPPLGSKGKTPINLSWCPDGTCLTVHDRFNAYRVFSAPYRDEPQVFDKRVDPDDVSAISADGRTVAYSRRNGSVQLFDRASGAAMGPPVQGHTGGVRSLRFTADGQRLIALGKDGLLRLWSTRTSDLPEAQLLHEAGAAATSLAVAPAGLPIAAGFDDRSIALWTDRKAPRVLKHTGEPIALRFSPDRSQLAVAGARFSRREGWVTLASDDGEVAVWRTGASESAPVSVVKPRLGRLLDVSWASDSELVVAGANGWLRQALGSASEMRANPWPGDSPEVHTALISPDARRVAAITGPDSAIVVLDTRNGNVVERLHPSGDGKRVALRWMPGSDRLVTASGKGVVMWALGGRDKRERVLSTTNQVALDLAISGDGQWVMLALSDGTVQWLKVDARVQASIGVETGYGAVARLAVDKGPESMLTSSLSGVVRRLSGPHRWADALCTRLSTNMSREAWRALVSPSVDYVLQCPGLPEAVD